ncbi:MAG: type II secretion system protein GspG [Planctomycetota bacterium]
MRQVMRQSRYAAALAAVLSPITLAADIERPFLRVDETEDRSEIALEIATREYVKKDGDGPTVALMGVAHIADAEFYDALQDALASYDLVLYESVTPPGTGGAGGASHDERVKSTEAAMRFVASIGLAIRVEENVTPTSINAIGKWSRLQDVRMGDWVDRAAIDAWSNPIEYRHTGNDGGGFALISYGEDGEPGGRGPAADIIVKSTDDIEPFAMAGEGDNLQMQLAQAINLSFQLEALDYSAENWRCSDMAIDQVERSLAARGLEFDLLGDTMAGSSLPAQFVKAVLRMIKSFDRFMDGALTDTFKVVLIEMLSDESLLDASMGQLGDGFMDVIINERNQVVVDDLTELIADEPQIKSVAVLYGAGHMQDLEKRLIEQLDYEAGDVTWYRAIAVDLNESAVTPREMRKIRVMMRRALKQAQEQQTK